jgi:hypothetical protein
MQNDAVPAALRERLGVEATAGLLDTLDAARREWRGDVIEVCAARFERRLVQETSSLRMEMAGVKADLRQEMATLRADLRQEMAALRTELRLEMGTLRTDLRQEMAALGTDLRQEIANGRFELLKWSFLFWVGQIVAISAIVGVMLRFTRA